MVDTQQTAHPAPAVAEAAAGVTEDVARFVIDTAEVPDDVRMRATQHLVDGVAVMLAGATEASGALVRAHLREVGGRPQAQVLGTALRAPLQLAAWANGVAGHALDYDDTQLATDPRSVYGLLMHPTVPTLAAALAAAEDLRAPGDALLDAYTIGVEVACRIADAIDPRHYRDGFHSTATMGVFGAAAAAARPAAGLTWPTTQSRSAGGTSRNGTRPFTRAAGRAAGTGRSMVDVPTRRQASSQVRRFPTTNRADASGDASALASTSGPMPVGSPMVTMSAAIPSSGTSGARAAFPHAACAVRHDVPSRERRRRGSDRTEIARVEIRHGMPWHGSRRAVTPASGVAPRCCPAAQAGTT